MAHALKVSHMLFNGCQRQPGVRWRNLRTFRNVRFSKESCS